MCLHCEKKYVWDPKCSTGRRWRCGATRWNVASVRPPGSLARSLGRIRSALARPKSLARPPEAGGGLARANALPPSSPAHLVLQLSIKRGGGGTAASAERVSRECELFFPPPLSLDRRLNLGGETEPNGVWQQPRNQSRDRRHKNAFSELVRLCIFICSVSKK